MSTSTRERDDRFVDSVRRVVLSALACLFVACGSDPIRLDPDPTAGLIIRVVTSGAAYDADGYVLVTDDGQLAVPLDLNDERMISLRDEPGTVELAGVASNCTVENGARRSIGDQEDGSTIVFEVECVAPPELSAFVIVFVRRSETGRGNAGHLYELSLRGGESVHLTSEGDDLAPTVSADGTRLAFQSLATGGSPCEIQVTTTDGSTLTSVPDCGSDPDWSPDGTRIAYAVGDGWFESRLRIWDFESEGFVDLPSEDFDGQPAWSPDGSWIAFARWRVGDSGIHVTRPDGNDAFPLTTGGSSPVWSPTAQRVAYVADGNVRLLTVADGASIEILSERERGRWEPTDWSADGEWIALTEWRGTPTGADVYLAHVSAGLLFRLTNDGLSHSAAFRDGG